MFFTTEHFRKRSSNADSTLDEPPVSVYNTENKTEPTEHLKQNQNVK